MLTILAVFFLPILARAALYAASDDPRSWRDADWSSTGLLPPAAQDKTARVIVFTGKAGAWKGMFAVHSWIVLKRAGASEWTRYDVVGWGSRCATNNWPPDGRWYGNMPVAIADISGPQAEQLIPKIEAAVADYSLRAGRRLPHLAGPEQQQLHRRGPARGAGTAAWRCRPTRSAATSAPASMPADRQRHRRRAQPVRARRAQDRLGRGHRDRSARPGRRARSAPSRPQAARLRPHRRGIAGRHRARALKSHIALTAFCLDVIAPSG